MSGHPPACDWRAALDTLLVDPPAVSDAPRFPAEAMQRLSAEGLLRAPLPRRLGGAGIGTEAGLGHNAFVFFHALGRLSLAVGRLVEAHVNAIRIVMRYGTEAQAEALADRVLNGALLGLWDTDPPDDSGHQKYAATHAALADRHYRAGLELGCSIGELSAGLAPHCETYLGLDIAEAPLAAARTRCAFHPAARFALGALPGDWPDGAFDLIILSEFLYLLAGADILRLAGLTQRAILPRGRILLVNWLGAATEPQPGDIAAEHFIAAVRFPVVTATKKPLYRPDLLAST